MKLSIGAGGAGKAFGIVFGLFFAAAGAAFALLPLLADGWLQREFGADPACPTPDEVSGIPPELLPPAVRDCLTEGDWLSFDAGIGGMRVIALIGVPVFLFGLYLALKAWRTAAWLDGTVVSVRGALTTRKVDLATAEVTAGSYTLRRNTGTSRASIEQVPQLVAREAGSRPVTIPLRGVGTPQLPEAELRALAAALRPGSPIARHLREMADDPFHLRAP
ncbi:hypothetical protein [Actinoplanes sp. NPDC051859]|uniref:hypothetical protein n=1 Tax=Actinoplanes sp. NPDC051859 TaxID=3363909 RepID=UPI0037B6106B